jgi:hypothetical protein
MFVVNSVGIRDGKREAGIIYEITDGTS